MQGDTLLTSDHTVVQLWVGSSRNWSVFLERPYHGTPLEGSGSLSMLPVDYTPWCSTGTDGDEE